AGPQGPSLLAVAIHRFAAVETHRRHGSARRPVDEQACAAEPLELLQGRKDGLPIEVDGSVELTVGCLEPRRPHARTVVRSMVAVQDGDFPLLDGHAASKALSGTF